MDVVVDDVAVGDEVGGEAGDAVCGAGVAGGAPPNNDAYPHRAQAAGGVASLLQRLQPACHLK